MEAQEQEECKMYGCWFYCIPGIGGKTIQKLVQAAGNEKEAYRSGTALWKRNVTEKQLEQLEAFRKRRSPGQLWHQMLQDRISFARRTDRDYPDRLQTIPDAPYGLFWKGKLPMDTQLSVAVIGARECSDYGRYVSRALGETLAKNDIALVSGMARGIDGVSQQAALAAGGQSYGVLGSGVDVCYPPSNRGLYEELGRQGGVLSIFPPGTMAKAAHFPQRNRIVSGLADAIVVIEAREKSGTLITVDMALEQGKEVYAVPGRVTDRLSDGCNRLIRQGAAVFVSPEELVRELQETVGKFHGTIFTPGAWKKSPDREQDDLSPEQRTVLEFLDFKPENSEEIYRKYCGQAKAECMSWEEFLQILMKLCIAGQAVQVTPGNFKSAVSFP